MNGLARDDEALRDFRGFLDSFKNSPERWRNVYTYDTYNDNWYYIDGTKKTPYVKRT